MCRLSLIAAALVLVFACAPAPSGGGRTGSGGAGGAGGSAGSGGAAGTGNGGGAPGGAAGGAGSGGSPDGATGDPDAPSGGDVPTAGDAGADLAVDTPTADGGGDARPADAPLGDAGPPGAIVTALDVAEVFSGHPVFFALVTRGEQQFAAFYDADRQMTVASRRLDGTSWKLVRLASTLGWDSHNYVAMGIDSAGFIHVAGNMHASSLVYFRTTQPLDIGTFQRVTAMVGSNEQSCTYPQFINKPSGELVFAYRDGGSGNGNHIFNVYEVATKTWRRLINSPLTDGQGQRNAYPVGPTLGPDGWWHLVYVWRDTPDAATNHDLSYARSRDLISWESGTGRALTIPITLAGSDIVDAVPAMGGMINNNTKVGFDSQNRPVVAYHKFDTAGNTQLYNARIEGGRWVTHKTSSWSYRWNFGGNGTLVFQIQLEGVKVDATGALIQVWSHMQYGGWNAFRLDETSLASVATIARPLPYPAELERVESTTAGMGVRWAADTGASPDPSVFYMLRWETLGENQDMPRSPIPPPTKLRLYALRK